MSESFFSKIQIYLFLLALLASFFVVAPVQAATLFGPGGAVVGRDSEYITTTIDASTFNGLHLSFDYQAEKLDVGDSFTYGWRGDTEEVLGTFIGRPEGTTAVPGDETGAVSVELPVTASVSNLEIFIRVTANSTINYDSVDVTNLIVTGTQTVIDDDNDGVIENDHCPATTVDQAGSNKLNPNHWRYDGVYWQKALSGGGKGNSSTYTMTDTRGCNCDQILDILAGSNGKDYSGQVKFGCTAGTIEEFMELVW